MPTCVGMTIPLPLAGHRKGRLVVRRETGKEQEVQVLYDEDVASHIAPKPCVVSREGRGEASAGDRAGWPSSRESAYSRTPTGLPTWKATRAAALPRAAVRSGVVSRPQHAWTLLAREPGDLVADRRRCAPSARVGKAKGPKPAMNGNEKSDLTIVAMKPANERPRGSKEWVERRVGAEGNVGGPHGVRAQERAATSSGIDRVRKAAQERKGEEFTTLLHHIDAALLRQAYDWLKRDAAPGVDGMTWDAYGEGLEAHLRDLESRIHLGSYRAQPSLRAYIPKPDGRQRPLGMRGVGG